MFLEALKRGAAQSQQEGEEEDFDVQNLEISEEEVAIVDEFLTKFTIVSESSMNDHLDIMLMLKALPNKIMDYSLDSTDQFNFRTF